MRKVTKLTEFVSKSNKGWGERDYLCIRKIKRSPEQASPPNKPHPQPLSEGRGEEKESEKGRVKW